MDFDGLLLSSLLLDFFDPYTKRNSMTCTLQCRGIFSTLTGYISKTEHRTVFRLKWKKTQNFVLIILDPLHVKIDGLVSALEPQN